MKLIFCCVLLLFTLSESTRKMRKHAANMDVFENGTAKFENFFNHSEHKLFNQLLQNFNENEQMSEIVSIFNSVKEKVTSEDWKLGNFSSEVMFLNRIITDFYLGNKFDFGDKKLRLELNTDIAVLQGLKANLTRLLKEIQANKTDSLPFPALRNTSQTLQNISASFKEVNDSSSIPGNTSNGTEPLLPSNQSNSTINTDTPLQFDLLFSLIKDVHRSHRLKASSRKSSALNLSEIQEKSGYHLQMISNNPQNLSSSLQMQGGNSSINCSVLVNKSIEKTLEDVNSIKSNLKSLLENVEIESNMLYNLNQRNKLTRMNLENYLIEQVLFLKNVIHDEKRTRKWSMNLQTFQNESKRALSNFEKLANASRKDDGLFKGLKIEISENLFSSVNSKNEFY